MSNEIQVRATTAKTIYALVWSAVGQVWNGSTFVAYATADLATYAVTMAEQGTASGKYLGTFPVVAAGAYGVEAFIRAGVSAAETDTLVGTEEAFEWDGTAVVPLSGIPANLLDLTSGVETGKTLRQAVRLIAAAVAGKRSNSGTTTEQFDAIGNPGTARVVGNLNSAGDGVPTLTP